MLTRISLQASVLRNFESKKATARKELPPPEIDSLAKLQLFPDIPPAGNRETGNALRGAQSADLDSAAAAVRRNVVERRLSVSFLHPSLVSVSASIFLELLNTVLYTCMDMHS